MPDPAPVFDTRDMCIPLSFCLTSQAISLLISCYYYCYIQFVKSTSTMAATASRLHALVIGYGLLGGNVLRALTSPPFASQVHTHVLVKPASMANPTKRAKLDSFAASGVTLVEGDVADGPAALATLLVVHSIRTVVNVAMTWPPTDVDTPVLVACKAAGVRHFIPSDYGFWADDMDESSPMWTFRYRAKAALHETIRRSGLDYTFFAVGGFAELLFKNNVFGVELATRTVKAPVSFDTRVTFTYTRDVGQLIAHAVVDPAARNALLYVGQVYTYEQVAAALEAATGEEVTRVAVSVEEAQAAIAKSRMDFQSMFMVEFALGKGTHWPVERTYRYPSFSYTPLHTVAEHVLKGEM